MRRDDVCAQPVKPRASTVAGVDLNPFTSRRSVVHPVVRGKLKKIAVASANASCDLFACNARVSGSIDGALLSGVRVVPATATSLIVGILEVVFRARAPALNPNFFQSEHVPLI